MRRSGPLSNEARCTKSMPIIRIFFKAVTKCLRPHLEPSHQQNKKIFLFDVTVTSLNRSFLVAGHTTSRSHLYCTLSVWMPHLSIQKTENVKQAYTSNMDYKQVQTEQNNYNSESHEYLKRSDGLVILCVLWFAIYYTLLSAVVC